MSIKIIKPGILASLQDTGRWGHRAIGIGSGGAMDGFAMRVANYLCRNDEDKAVIEINFPSPEIMFRQDAVISLTGADFTASLDETIIPTWRALFVKKDSVLKFKQPISGARSYLAVHGGWQAENWLGSFSTHLKVGAGGHCGRALQKDDVINFPINNFSFEAGKVFPWNISENELDKIYQPANNIRCIKGVEYDLLDEASKQHFEQQDLTISYQSDRMGYRLNTEPRLLQEPTELISSPVDAGIVQLLPDGNCIILMADHQTTGGYARIASVIKADTPKLAQLKPGQPLNFTMISLQEAEDTFLYIQQMLQEIKVACHHNLKTYLHQ
jgi:antagonist of KipI